MAIAATASDATPKGILAYNASRVGMLQSCLSNLDSGMGTVPNLILAIDAGNCWREFKFPDSDVVRWNAADFRQFIEAKRPKGCDTPIAILERALRGTPAWETFLRLERGERGGLQHEERDELGRFHKCDLVTLVDSPDTIPFVPTPEPSPAPAPQDSERKPPTGNSTSYALRQLERGRAGKPARPDLLEKVKTGEMTPNAACVAAGFRVKAITLAADPKSAARVLARHFNATEIADLIEALNDILKTRA